MNYPLRRAWLTSPPPLAAGRRPALTSLATRSPSFMVSVVCRIGTYASSLFLCPCCTAPDSMCHLLKLSGIPVYVSAFCVGLSRPSLSLSALSLVFAPHVPVRFPSVCPSFLVCRVWVAAVRLFLQQRRTRGWPWRRTPTEGGRPAPPTLSHNGEQGRGAKRRLLVAWQEFSYRDDTFEAPEDIRPRSKVLKYESALASIHVLGEPLFDVRDALARRLCSKIIGERRPVWQLPLEIPRISNAAIAEPLFKFLSRKRGGGAYPIVPTADGGLELTLEQLADIGGAVALQAVRPERGMPRESAH